MFKSAIAIIIMMIIFSVPIQTQSSTKLNWTQDAAALSEAQAYTYRYYLDGSTTGIIFSSVICTGNVTPFSCQAPFPIVSPGNHTLELTAENITGESAKSSPPFGFAFPVAPKCCTISK